MVLFSSAKRCSWFVSVIFCPVHVSNPFLGSGVGYKFNLVNMEKGGSAFSAGMRPVVFNLFNTLSRSTRHLAFRQMYSAVEAEKTGASWFRASSSEDICYYRNYHKRPYS